MVSYNPDGHPIRRHLFRVAMEPSGTECELTVNTGWGELKAAVMAGWGATHLHPGERVRTLTLVRVDEEFEWQPNDLVDRWDY